MNQKENKIVKLEAMLLIPKFLDDDELGYIGIGDINLRTVLAQCINNAIIKFISITSHDGSNTEYLEAMSSSLDTLYDLKLMLDTADSERVCEYFEQLMDIVGMSSSEGLLNTWMYGFDPSEKN